MAMYGIALLPLMDMIKNETVTQKWYADDGNPVGSLQALNELHEKLQRHGPAFGYNITKCHVIAKPTSIDNARNVFRNKDIKIVDGCRVLGSVIGSESACRENKMRNLQKIQS